MLIILIYVFFFNLRYFLIGDIEKIYLEMIFNWFVCNFKDFDLNGLINLFIFLFIFEYLDYIKCVWLFYGKFFRMKIIKKCVYLLCKWCLIVKIWIIKIIWFIMFMIEKFLVWLLGLKIVYLIWDFCGILNFCFEKNVEVMNL